MSQNTDLTRRSQQSHLMSLTEKMAFARAVEQMPWLYDPILSELTRVAASANSLHDVACGNGYLLSVIAERYPHLKLTGCDLDPDFAAASRLTVPGRTITCHDALVCRETADIIVCNLSLHHIDEPEQLLTRLQANARQTVIVVDQLRPDRERELLARLTRRQHWTNSLYYSGERERQSILEAYSRVEIEAMINRLPFSVDCQYIDDDYYERVILTITQTK